MARDCRDNGRRQAPQCKQVRSDFGVTGAHQLLLNAVQRQFLRERGPQGFFKSRLQASGENEFANVMQQGGDGSRGRVLRLDRQAPRNSRY